MSPLCTAQLSTRLRPVLSTYRVVVDSWIFVEAVGKTARCRDISCGALSHWDLFTSMCVGQRNLRAAKRTVETGESLEQAIRCFGSPKSNLMKSIFDIVVRLPFLGLR